MKHDDGYIAYIVNPKAGAGSQKTISHQFRHFLLDRNFRVNTLVTGSLKDGFQFASALANEPACKLVVVAGGDGIIREVADGLRGSPKPLLIVPAGTENLLASELGFDEKFKTLVKTFQEGYTKPLDLGVVNGKSFTSIIGLGFDGVVVKRVQDLRLGHIDHLDYFGPLWRTFWDYKFDKMKVEVDGRTIFDGRGLVFVGNTSRYAMGLEILKYADCSDGLLDVCIYKCANRLHLVKHSFATVIGCHCRGSDVIYQQGKFIRITSERDIPSEIDGDPGPVLPVDIKIIPAAVNVMVPKGAKPTGVFTRFIRALG